MAKGGNKKKRGPDAKLRVVVGGKGQAQAIVSGAPRAAAAQKAAASLVTAGPSNARTSKPRVHERAESAEATLEVEAAPTLGLPKKPFDRRIIYGAVVIAALGLMWWFSRGPSPAQPPASAPSASAKPLAPESASVDVIPPPPSPPLPAASSVAVPALSAPAPAASASASIAPTASARAPTPSVAPTASAAPPTAAAPPPAPPAPAAPKPATPKPPQDTPYE